MPAAAERMRAAAARPPDRARSPRPLRDYVPDSVQTPVPPSPDTCAALVEAFHEWGIDALPRAARRGARRARHGRARRRHPPRCTTSSSACRSTARPTSSWRAAWPRTATSRSTRERSPRASRVSSRSATARRSACRKPGSSPSARQESSRRQIVTQARRRPTRRALRRARLVLHRVRRRPSRPCRRRLLLRPEADRHAPEPSAELVAEKEHFGSSRRARWFS